MLFLPFLLNNSSTAQTGVRFGFKGGYSMATHYGITPPDIPYTVDTGYRSGWAGGIMAYFPVTESFGVQQEFLYVMKGSSQDITMNDLPVNTYTEYDLNYLELPIVLRYAFARLGNFKIYGCSGFALSILLDGESELKGIVEMGGVQTSFTESNNMKGVDTFDYGFLYGAGVDFNLFDKNCFFEYRFNIGWNTLMLPTSEGGEPAPLRNQGYIFTLGMYL